MAPNVGPGLPSAGGSVQDRRRLAPARWVPARSRAGIQAFSRESPDAKSRGGRPPAPPVYGPLVGTRWFWRLLSRIRSRGYFLRNSKTDLERIFREKYAEKAFYERKSPNQGTYMGTVIAPPPGQCGTNPKTSERQQAGHKNPGSRGQSPRPSFSPFLGRNGDPRRVGGATGRCAPRPRKSLDHPKGTQYRTAPPPGTGRETTPQVWTCAGPNGTPCRSGREPPRPRRARAYRNRPVGGIAATARAGRWTRR